MKVYKGGAREISNVFIDDRTNEIEWVLGKAQLRGGAEEGEWKEGL